jgi:predicted nucleic acid-binding protein
MMFLADTNLYLEILLGQEKKETCKKFLYDNAKALHISDFSLHSIGVILFKFHKEEVFQNFVLDIMQVVTLLNLPTYAYKEVVRVKLEHGLDFDDAYQYAIAKHFGLRIVTMDRDFERTSDDSVLYL